jgi:acyl transferase domain-containing protein/thioesterase domain-containing protein/acyl carrier protein
MNDDAFIATPTDVAIIGYAARFPGAGNAAQYWENLRQGVESIRPFSAKELESVGVSAEALRDPDYVRVGAPLSQLDAFDAGFFGISLKEAAIMDPQQRFFMESAWEALEHAGYAPGTFTASTGVFAGSGPNSYLINNLLSDPELVAKEGIFLLRHTGNDKDVLATRMSYQMNLRGPSINVQTACSTSLVAVHLACQSLLHLDCDMALAGAVSIEIPHAIGYQYRQNEIQSHDGHCRAFDANATGTVFGSGVGIVVLKRLQDALDDGDTIHAVIKGTAVNNDGDRKVGFLVPSAEGQVEVILEALGAAGVEPSSVDYVETHGTGTPIGDPIELSALGTVYAERDRKLNIGSVKTNIGHLDTAAGMAGLLKTVLALKHQQIPPTLHFKTLNPLVNSAKTKLQVVNQLTEWAGKKGDPRRAGVTSLGIGGTNAHAILEEAPPLPATDEGRPVKLITLSAKSPEALDNATRALAVHLTRHPDENLADIAYTLHVGRHDFPHRRMFPARDHAEAVQRAEQSTSSGVFTSKASEPHPVTFLFSGQGSQHVNMGAQLYQTEPIFQRWIDACAQKAKSHLGFDFRTILYPTPETAAHAAAEMKLTWNAQPILFSFEYALAQLWLSWGIVPGKLIGHSLGEYTAACLSGIFSLDDALSLVCARGNLMHKVAEGAMLAVPKSEAEVTPWITDELSLAAVNGPAQCVLAGPTASILALKEKLAAQGIASHRLDTSHAFHSRSIEPILDLFIEMVATKKLRAPRIPIVSNVTGQLLTDVEATDPRYWARHFRQAVRFHDGITLLHSESDSFLLEVGPGETLATLARQAGGSDARIFASLPRHATDGALAAVLSALGQLWINGTAVNWKAFHAGQKRRRVPLPTYPFQRKKLWIGPKIGSNWLGDSLANVDNWFYRANWKSAPLPTTPASTGPCLVFADDAKLIGEMRRPGETIIAVTAGEKFAASGDDAYVLNPASPDDYGLLFDQLARRNQVPRRIVYLWGLDPSTAPEDRCFHSLVSIIQTLGARLPDKPVALTAVSRRSVSIRRESVLHPYGSLLIGPCRVAPLEYPTLRCRQVDVDSTDPAQLAALILRESASDTPESLAVYRDSARWVQGVERFQPEPAVADRLREKGTYLITGGLGGIGMAVADWLARSHRPRLILLSRRSEPDATQKRQIAEWLERGAEVLVATADVTDRASLQAALDLARNQFGPINGIVHAAGTLQDGIIQLKKREVAHTVLAPKTIGVELLDELTRDQPLDFFAHFSSISALTPPDGQVDYCAANAFLNAYAQSQPVERNFIVIGWSQWTQVGMVAPKDEPTAAPFNHPLLDRVELDTAARTIYSGTLSVERNWVLGEHHFHGGDSLLPGTAHLEIAVTALWKKLGEQPVTLENIVFLAPLRVAPNTPCIVHAELRKSGAGYQFTVSSDEVVYVSGQCRRDSGPAPRIDLKEILRQCPKEIRDGPKNVRQRGHFDFGPRWQSLRTIHFGREQCLGLVELPSKYSAEAGEYSLHPALMDIATGVAMYLIPGYEKAGDLLLPFAYQRLTVYRALPARVYAHARMRPESGTDLTLFDLTLADENGEVVAEIHEFTVKRLRSVADLSHAATEAVPHSNGETAATPRGIPTREGLAALQRVLNSRAQDMIFVSPTPLVLAAPVRETVALADPITAPSDDINLVLEQLWQSLLGLDHVDATTDFFDAGGHSLLAVRLFTEIRKRFQVDLGLSTLFEARTVGALGDLIRKAREADPAQKTVTATPGIVAIRSSTSTNTPLFLIHDVGGGVLRYEHLARHFPDNQAIFAIESRGLNGHPTDFTVEEMARNYVAQIRERQPRGPYYVAGHSFGGLVTYEIGRQLTALGETMGLVGLIDTFQRSLIEEDNVEQVAPRTDKLPLFKRLVTDLRAVILGQDRIGYLQERSTYVQAWAVKTAYRTAFRISHRHGLRMPSFLNDVKEANWIASDYFTPGTYAGEIVLFRCQNRLDTDPPDSSRIWQRLARGGVVIRECPGDHNSMLREPGVAILADQILSFLQSAKR